MHGAGGQRLAEFGQLDGYRGGAEHLGDLGGGRVVGAHLGALDVGRAVDRLHRIQRLPWPRHRVKQLQALCGEDLLLHRPGGVVEAAGVGVAGGEEGDRVDAEQGVLVGKPGNDEFAHGHQAGLDRPLDLRLLEQRGARMQGDRELAAGAAIDIVDELLEVLGLEGVRSISRRQVPLGLRLGGECGCGKAGKHQSFHHSSPLCFVVRNLPGGGWASR